MKMNNVMLEPSGYVKMVDFGVVLVKADVGPYWTWSELSHPGSKQMDDDDAALNQLNFPPAMLNYTSINPNRPFFDRLGHKEPFKYNSDVEAWQLGLLIYQLLEGDRLFVAHDMAELSYYREQLYNDEEKGFRVSKRTWTRHNSAESWDLLRALLSSNVSMRLEKFAQLRHDPWIIGTGYAEQVDWSRLEKRSYQPVSWDLSTQSRLMTDGAKHTPLFEAIYPNPPSYDDKSEQYLSETDDFLMAVA